MKIVVDAYGNDLGPIEPVKASVEAVNKFDDLQIVLAGDEEELNSLLAQFNYQKDKIEIVDAK